MREKVQRQHVLAATQSDQVFFFITWVIEGRGELICYAVPALRMLGLAIAEF